MTTAALQQLFPSYTPFYAADSEYAQPTLGWLKNAFYTYFWNDRVGKGLKTWARKNDCDNFARAYAQAASDCHGISAGSDKEGLAVGEFWYHSPAGPHAIVVAIVDDQPVYIEPQTGNVLQLTAQQISTCFLVKF